MARTAAKTYTLIYLVDEETDAWGVCRVGMTADEVRVQVRRSLAAGGVLRETFDFVPE